MAVDVSKIVPGDRIKVKLYVWGSTIRGWRKVTGLWKEGIPMIRCNGTNEFIVRPHEILEHYSEKEKRIIS